jgi:hypothetical protein
VHRKGLLLSQQVSAAAAAQLFYLMLQSARRHLALQGLLLLLLLLLLRGFPNARDTTTTTCKGLMPHCHRKGCCLACASSTELGPLRQHHSLQLQAATMLKRFLLCGSNVLADAPRTATVTVHVG